MYKFIQRKKTLLLAIFGVLLMIAFLLPIGFGQMQTNQDDIVVGRVGDEPLTVGERRQAISDLDAMRFIEPAPQAPEMQFMQRSTNFAPLFKLAESNPFGQGGRVAAMLIQSPETYALLQREAKAAGIQPDPNTVEELFETYYRNSPSIKRAEDAQYFRGVIERFLLVRDHYMRVLGNVKPTRPQALQSIIGQQQPTVNIAEFPATDFLAEAPAPTEEQIVAHYNKYAAVTALPQFSLAATQPVQFGYRAKDRVKLQYLELPAADLAVAAMKSLKPVDLVALDSVAYAYFIANQELFQTTPATQPATAPATGPATNPATQPATVPAAKPTTRPFAEVRGDIRRKILANEVVAATASAEDVAAAAQTRQKVDAAAEAIRKALRDRLEKDYKDAVAAKDLARIEKVDYLETVANDIQKAHGLRPAVKSLASDFLTPSDLSALPGIGLASADDLPFSVIATKHATEIKPEGPEMPKTQPATAPATTTATTNPSTAPSTQPAKLTVEPTKPAKSALALLEPSPLLKDFQGNAYVFRLTAFEGEHVPTLDQVRDAIVKDLKLVAAYDLARKRANIVREGAGSAAGSSPIGGLPIVAPPVKEVGPISMDNEARQVRIPGYDVSDPAVQQALLRGVSQLLTAARADVPHPCVVVELPSKQKVLAVELRGLEKPWTAEEDARMQTQLLTIARNQFIQNPEVQEALLSWFEPEAVATRMNYKKEKD